MKKLSMSAFVIIILLISTSNVFAKDASLDVSIKHEIENSIRTGLQYLSSTQEPDGSWGHYPGVSGLVLTAFSKSPETTQAQHEKIILNGYKYLMSHVQPDGGIYPSFEPQLRSYNTSICLMALVEAEAPAFEQLILNARRYLVTLQADEKSGVMPDSSTYGGIGYNKDERSDISNMQFALEALKASEDYELRAQDKDKVKMDGDENSAEIKTDINWDKAIQFLQRSQNFKKYNNYAWSTDDGGFIYYPGASKAGGTTSYGGMTYAGMKSFIHAGLDKDDERVQAAYKWVKNNYTVEENPEMGVQGLFYYYHTMAKALTIFGADIIEDTSGEKHNWREDLAKKIISIQNTDGSWVNENGRWWENNPALVTAYTVMALQEILK